MDIAKTVKLNLNTLFLERVNWAKVANRENSKTFEENQRDKMGLSEIKSALTKRYKLKAIAANMKIFCRL